MMKVERTDKETGKTKIYEEHSWISRHACINYNPNEIIDDNNPMDNMVEMLWWGEFKDMADNETLFAEAVSWCKEYCKGLIYASHFSGKFEFELEEDAMGFRLRWI